VKRQKLFGFTLVELMVVVIILGILAAVVVPQFSNHTDEARLATLDANLTEMRNAIELYYHQHGGTYPGAMDATNPTVPSTTPSADFVKQLTQYTDSSGKASVSGGAGTAYPYGPYLRKPSLPVNPFNNDPGLVTDNTTIDVTVATADGTTGWKFVVKTGRFFANDPKNHASR
jgi:general secretion pathway protein G